MSFMENDFATGETSWTDTRSFFSNKLTQLAKEVENNVHIQSALEAEGRRTPVESEEPFVPFYKPDGMSEEEYASEIHRMEQARSMWQTGTEMNQALTDLADYHRSKVIE